jgi:hypothetical protein
MFTFGAAFFFLAAIVASVSEFGWTTRRSCWNLEKSCFFSFFLFFFPFPFFLIVLAVESLLSFFFFLPGSLTGRTSSPSSLACSSLMCSASLTILMRSESPSRTSLSALFCCRRVGVGGVCTGATTETG